jgi:hypothetical protein
VNERGDYLVHPDQAREFGFEIGEPHRIQDEFPQLAQALTAGAWDARLIQDRAGKQFGVALVPVQLAEGRRINLIAALPRPEMATAANAARDSSLLAGLAAVLGAILLAVLLARSLTRPLAQITAAVESRHRAASSWSTRPAPSSSSTPRPSACSDTDARS